MAGYNITPKGKKYRCLVCGTLGSAHCTTKSCDTVVLTVRMDKLALHVLLCGFLFVVLGSPTVEAADTDVEIRGNNLTRLITVQNNTGASSLNSGCVCDSSYSPVVSII